MHLNAAANHADSAVPALDARTRALLEAPIVPTLLRMAAPNMVVMVSQAAVGLIETYFIGRLGTEALAGMALVFPLVMLMQMLSGGAIGGGISSAIARALGGGRRDDASALVLHAVAIGLALGLLNTALLLAGGRWLYTRMGGTGAALEAALVYSNWVFAGAVLVWLFNALASVIRGAGNMAVPAAVTFVGTLALALVPLSPLLIFGWGPVPRLGIAGGALALLLFYLGGSVVLALYLRSPRSLLRPALTQLRLRAAMFADILRVGAAGAVSTLSTNLAIGLATALAATFGTAAVAGYGTASRLEYLLVPLVFGLGGPLVAIVGTCVGAGQRQRALRATWAGAAIAFAATETIGLAAAAFPRAWLSLFDSDPAMLDAGVLYLRTVGPLYGFFGLGLILYFASQGAGRLLWPVIANVARLVVAAVGGWLALRAGLGLGWVFAAQGAALVTYGVVNSIAIARGVWFTPTRAALPSSNATSTPTSTPESTP